MHLIDQQLNLMLRGNFKEAWEISEKLEETMPNDYRHMFNRGWFLLQQGKYQEGFQSLEAGRFLSVYGSPRLNTDKPIWNPKNSLVNKTVIINMEGGYGDCIIHIRFANEIKKRGGKAIICCHPSLNCLFERVIGVYKCISIHDIKRTPHDYWIPSFSCSWLFGHEYETIPNEPYIIPKRESIDIWKTFLQTDKKLKVGIRWSGSPKFEHQQFRIFSADNLINLYKDYNDIEFYSLQRDDDIRELPSNIRDLENFLLSWEDTAAAIENMDLIITSCTSIAHLSAAMGKKTWVIVPLLPYHVWAYGGDHSPWYPKTTKVYRQTNFESWKEPFDLIRKDLYNELENV